MAEKNQVEVTHHGQLAETCPGFVQPTTVLDSRSLILPTRRGQPDGS
jgi:hypothetical protein